MKGIGKWIIGLLISAIVGSFVTYLGSNHIYPIWNTIWTNITGKKCVYIAEKGRPVEIFAKSVTSLMAEPGKSNYSVFCTEASKQIELANTTYEPQKNWVEVVKHVVNRNGCNIQYYIDDDPNRRFILICACGEVCDDTSR